MLEPRNQIFSPASFRSIVILSAVSTVWKCSAVLPLAVAHLVLLRRMLRIAVGFIWLAVGLATA